MTIDELMSLYWKYMKEGATIPEVKELRDQFKKHNEKITHTGDDLIRRVDLMNGYGKKQ